MLDHVSSARCSLDAEQRYANARELLADLERWQAIRRGGPDRVKSAGSPDDTKSALGSTRHEDDERGAAMARDALRLARETGRLMEAADMMEQAMNLCPICVSSTSTPCGSGAGALRCSSRTTLAEGPCLIEKSTASKSHRGTRYDVLLAEAVPELVRVNAFRLTQLPVTATQREIGRQVEKVRMAEKLGVAAGSRPVGSCLCPAARMRTCCAPRCSDCATPRSI